MAIICSTIIKINKQSSFKTLSKTLILPFFFLFSLFGLFLSNTREASEINQKKNKEMGGAAQQRPQYN
jgi:hypothetical protein